MTNCDTCGKKDGCPSAGAGGCSDGENKSFSDMKEAPHALSKIKKIYGVCSGKGGVGKSFVTSVLAAKLSREGYQVGILDADITGPSIPMAFGLKGPLKGSEEGIIPAVSHSGIQVVSLNLLSADETAPVIWRGPVISGVVKQFWTDVIWRGLDVLLIDMPPGTGDVPLTVFQSIPLDGIIMVSTPQDLVSMVVSKAQNMAKMMDVEILGFVENMSYLKCPCCEEKITVFGEGGVDKAAEELSVPVLDKLPIDKDVTKLVDKGEIEKISTDVLDHTVKFIEALIQKG